MTADAAQPASNADSAQTAAPDASSFSASIRRHHHWMLVIAAAVVVLSVVFDVRPDQRVFVRGLPDFPMPGTCPSREFFHVDCPGCGLTRSFVFLAHGQWRESLHVHRVGWTLALAVLAQFPYRLACLRQGRPVLPEAFLKFVSAVLITLLIGNWLVGLWI